MEYRTNDSKHYGEPHFNNNLFRYRNKFQWLLRNRLRDCFGGLRFQRDRHGFAISHMRWIFKYDYSQWCNQLFLEHWRNYSKYYGESHAANYLYRNRK